MNSGSVIFITPRRFATAVVFYHGGAHVSCAVEKPQKPAPDEPGAPAENAVDPGPAVEGADFYYEGPYLVFTAEYLLRRGNCCRSGCRHCPYGFIKDEDNS